MSFLVTLSAVASIALGVITAMVFSIGAGVAVAAAAAMFLALPALRG